MIGEQHQLLGVDQGHAPDRPRERREHRDRAVGGERPEHPRHLDALAVADDEGQPEDRGQRQQDAGRDDRDLERGGKGQQREPRGPLEPAGRSCSGIVIMRRVRRSRVAAKVEPLSARSAAASTSAGSTSSGSGSRPARRPADRRDGRAGPTTSIDSVGIGLGRATASIAPAASGRRSRRSASSSSRRRAADRCRRR